MQVHCISVSEHVWVVGREGGGVGARGGGVGGCYQPGVYVPLKALFLFFLFQRTVGQTVGLKKKSV